MRCVCRRRGHVWDCTPLLLVLGALLIGLTLGSLLFADHNVHDAHHQSKSVDEHETVLLQTESRPISDHSVTIEHRRPTRAPMLITKATKPAPLRVVRPRVIKPTPQITATTQPEAVHHDTAPQHSSSLVSSSIQLQPDIDCSAEAVLAERRRITSGHAPRSVDVVFTYVDGEDPAWRASYAEFAQHHTKETSQISNRYRNWDELRFAMRSVYMHAHAWVRRIFLVVSARSQLPKWLEKFDEWSSTLAAEYKHDDSKGIDLVVHVVYHHILFEDPVRQLPTFNSLAIESVLHRIPGLSYFFLYMNNDVFFNRETPLSTFMTAAHYKQYLDWPMHPGIDSYYETEMCFVIPMGNSSDREVDVNDHDIQTQAMREFYLRADGPDIQCFYSGRVQHQIPFFLDRWLMYRLYDIELRFWPAHIPHLWQRCVAYDIERGPLRAWLLRSRRNRIRDHRTDVSMHLQQEAVLVRDHITVGPFRFVGSMLTAEKVEKLDRLDTLKPAPRVLQVHQLHMGTMNQRFKSNFYLYKVFTDRDLIDAPVGGNFREPWIEKFEKELQLKQQFVCIDDDLKKVPDRARQRHSRELTAVFKRNWPAIPAWENRWA